MKKAKVTGKVRKERIQKNLLRVRGCGGFLQGFVAERELLQTTGHLVGRETESPSLRSSARQKTHQKHQSSKGRKKQAPARL